MTPSVIRRLGVVQLLALVAAYGDAPVTPNSGFDWPRSSAAAAGLDTARLTQLLVHVADSVPNLNALVIVRGGVLAWEWYHQASDTNEAYDTHSVTKSALTAFFGQALQAGLIESLDQPLVAFYPDADDRDVDPRLRHATLRHLLAMTSGLENELTQRVPFESRNLVERLLRLPLLFAPGEGWHYDMANSHLLSGIVSKVRGGQSVGTWAAADLFQRLNVTAGRWQSDYEDVSLGWTGLYLNARDLAKLGELFLRDGVWLGERLLPPGFAEEVAGTVTVPRPDEFADYALHWWTTDRYGPRAWIAAGFRHQYLVILPDLDAVIVMQSESVSPRAPITNHFRLFEDYLFGVFD